MHSTRVDIIEQKQVGNVTWGRTKYGWFCMAYIKITQ